jgi:hypothetical protein
MTPARDAIIRARAERYMAWAESELARTEPLVEFPERLDHSVHREDWKAEMDAHFARRRAWDDRPEIRALNEYRSWLYEVRSFTEYRRRHPIVRALRRSRNLGLVERGEYGEPTAQFRWHWQNLDGDVVKRPHAPSFMGLGLPDLRHSGRAWFDWYVRSADRTPLKIEVEWATGKAVWSSGISYARKNSGTITLHASIRPIASLYLILTHLWPRRQDEPSRTYSISLVDGSLHYDLGKPGSGDEWHRDDPLNWMRGCIFVADRIFGRAACTTENIGPPVQAVACFPEGQYTLTLQRQVWTWKRPRWPWSYWRRSVDIALEKPPEFQGRGENSYDCGPDAIYGMSSEGHSYEDAVATYVKAVLRERAKRGHLAPEHRTVLTEAAR